MDALRRQSALADVKRSRDSLREHRLRFGDVRIVSRELSLRTVTVRGGIGKVPL